jgi:hypothetical protein
MILARLCRVHVAKGNRSRQPSSPVHQDCIDPSRPIHQQQVPLATTRAPHRAWDHREKGRQRRIPHHGRGQSHSKTKNCARDSRPRLAMAVLPGWSMKTVWRRDSRVRSRTTCFASFDAGLHSILVIYRYRADSWGSRTLGRPGPMPPPSTCLERKAV